MLFAWLTVYYLILAALAAAWMVSAATAGDAPAAIFFAFMAGVCTNVSQRCRRRFFDRSGTNT